jgi:hypothetical protein
MRSEELTGIAQKVFFFLCVIRNLIPTMKCHFTTGKCPHIFNLEYKDTSYLPSKFQQSFEITSLV